MKAYIHKGAGHWIGSCIIVIAEDSETASRMIREELDSCGLEDEQIKKLEVFDLDKNQTILKINGDY